MDTDETSALMWALIAKSHAESALLEVEKAEMIYEAHPGDHRLGFVIVACGASAFATTSAEEAWFSFAVGNYEDIIELAHRAFAYLTHAREAVYLLTVDESR